MILGIVAAAVFVLVSAAFFTEKLKNGSRIRKLFSVIHKPLGYLFAALAAFHLALTLPLIRQRPAVIYILGIAMVICAMSAILICRRRKDKRKALAWHRRCALLLALLLAAHILFCITSLGAYKRDVAAISFADPDISSVADGEYTGECDVGYIYAEVKVTVIGGAVTEIELLEHRNERGRAGEGVVGAILSEQRSDVDAVSGATYSSKVIKKAVENALAKGISY
jgi:uncharacterized protein with FMN-binding domain